MQEEFRAIASLEHPQIARALDFGYTEDGVPFYTREYVPGRPLPPGPPAGESPEAFLRPLLDLLEATTTPTSGSRAGRVVRGHEGSADICAV